MKKRYIAIAVIAVVVGGSAIAYAAIPDSKGIIHGCRNNGSGVLRVIDTGQKCLASETPLDWVQSAGFEVYRSFGFSPSVEITAVGPASAQHVMTLTLQPGSYQISTYVEVQKDSGNGDLLCYTLAAPGIATSVQRAAIGTAPGDSRLLSMSGSGLVDLADGGNVELFCRQNAGATGANPLVIETDITAVRIGTVSQHEDGQG
jgi:hypothetical protein